MTKTANTKTANTKLARKTRQRINKVNSKASTNANGNDPVAKLQTLRAEVNATVVGRDDLVDAVLLALVAGQNVLALGVPGTAKTMLVQRIAQAFTDTNGVFDCLLTKFTKPSEIFGPTDIAALEAGELRTKTEGFLATSKVGVIDEVFKGSSAILNALLRIANERTFRNGNVVEESPVRMLVGMSNEYPEDATLLGAFFDRFAVKLKVDYLDGDDFEAMLSTSYSSKSFATSVNITDDDFAILDARRNAVEMPSNIIKLVAELRAKLQAKEVVISDRRFVQLVKLMAANAVLNGRDRITRDDFRVAEYVCWNGDEDLPIIKGLLNDFVEPMNAEIGMIVDEVNAARRAVLVKANFDGSDASRHVPDLASATGAAAQLLKSIQSASSRLDILAEASDTDEDAAIASATADDLDELLVITKAVFAGHDPDALDKLNDFEF